MIPVIENPFRIWEKGTNHNVKPLINNQFEPGNIPRQLLKDNYFYQSGEVEIMRRTTLQLGSVSGSNVGALIMNKKSIDIDTEDDL